MQAFQVAPKSITWTQREVVEVLDEAKDKEEAGAHTQDEEGRALSMIPESNSLPLSIIRTEPHIKHSVAISIAHNLEASAESPPVVPPEYEAYVNVMGGLFNQFVSLLKQYFPRAPPPPPSS